MTMQAGQLVMLDHLLPDHLDAGAYDVTTGTRVETFDTNNATYMPFTLPNWALLNGALLAIATKDSHNNGLAIIKIADDGTESDFILHGALSDLPGISAGHAPMGILVDDANRIYVVTYDNFGTPAPSNPIKVRRFHTDGTLDTNWTITPMTPVAPYTRVAPQVNALSALSTDGHYLYYDEEWFGAPGVTPWVPEQLNIVKVDLTSSPTPVETIFHSYFRTTAGVFPNRTADGLSYISAVGLDPNSGDVFVGYLVDHVYEAPGTNFGRLGTHNVYIDRINSASTVISQVELSNGHVPNWFDTTFTNPTSDTTDPGEPYFFTFGGGKLWTIFPNDGLATPSQGTMQLVSVDLASAALGGLPGWFFDEYTSLFPLIIYNPAFFPGLARIPAANTTPTWGPTLP